MKIKMLSVFLFMFSTFEDFESRWMLFCEYYGQPEKLIERFNLERRLANVETD